jgi:O-antigen/teichoic acid export membrane protein
MKDLRKIGVNMLSGGAGYIVPMAVNVITTPYILKHLGEEAYGLQVIANVIIGYLMAADMGLDIPVTHRVAEYHAKKLPEQLSKFLLATIKIYFLIGSFGAIVLLLLTQQLISWLSIPPNIVNDARIILYLSALGFFGSLITMWGKAVFNGFQRYEISNGINIANNLLSILIGIVLINFGYGVIGYFCARVFCLGLASALYFVLAARYFTKFSLRPFIDAEIWAQLRKEIGYGLSLRFSGMVFSRMDQTIISARVGISSVALYSFPMLISNTISGLIASITHFSFPMVSAMSIASSKEEVRVFFFRITKFIVFVSTFLFVPMIIFGDTVIGLWLSPEIAFQSKVVLPLLLFSFYVNSCLTIGLNTLVIGSGQLKYFTMYSVGRGVFLFIGFLYFIKPFGSIAGAGYSYTMAILIDVCFVLYTLKVKFHINAGQMFLEGYAKSVSLGFFFGLIFFVFKGFINTWIELTLLMSIYGILFLGIGYLIGVLNESERLAVILFLKKVVIFKNVRK